MSSLEALDSLFKKPALPSHKRKLEPGRDPSEIYKSAKTSSNGTAKSNGKVLSAQDYDNIEAGPRDDEDYGPDVPDDEEGRFFGGGVTQEENEILDYLDGQELVEFTPEKLDSAWVRKLALNFEKKITKNAQLRAKFENDPQKFMGSEADLDAEIKALSILADHPKLYGEFVKLGCVASLVSLLAHENTDIAIDAVEIISELTDEDVEAEQAQWNEIVHAMIEADLLDLLVSNFARLDEANESDRSGVYHALSVLENLASQPTLAEKLGQETTVFSWLLSRAQKRESPVTQNKQYAAEVLAILLQSSRPNRVKLIQLNGIDMLLQLLSSYRKRDPVKGSEEEEYVENLFDALTCTVDEAEGKSVFVEAEGVELALLMLQEGKMSKSRALRLIDHALSGPNGIPVGVCERLVEAGGLKVIFSTFMKRCDGATTEHLLGIFASLLRHLPAHSAVRIRTLAKFVEKDYAKLAKLVHLRRDYAQRLAVVDTAIRHEQKSLPAQAREDMADEWLSRRLDAGFFCLQSLDVVLAWLIAEDDGAACRVKEFLSERGEGLHILRETIMEQIEFITGESDDEMVTADMLKTLASFLI